MLWPVFRTADVLREQIGGEKYWQRRRHALKRAKLNREGFEHGDLVGAFHEALTAKRAGRAASCPLQDDTASMVTPQKRSNDGLLLAPTGASSACWRKKNRRTTPRT